MKTFPTVALFALGLVTAAFPLIAATDTTAPADTTPGAKFPRLRAMMIRRMAVAKRVAKKLGLSSDQIAQLKALRQQAAGNIKGLRTDSTLTKEQKKAKALAVLQNTRTQMRGVLTADQQARLDQMRQRLGAFRQGMP
jgi:Spy/CpxP family protein refolding chaperone